MGSGNKKKPALPPQPLFGERPGQNKAQVFSDPSDKYANDRGYYIQFEYFHGAEAVKFVSFKAFITEFTDNFASNWNSEEVYGRPDPIHTFQNTVRTINISWDVPSAGMAEAQENLAKASKMMRFLYPSYRQEGNASTLTKPPLLRMRFTNLIKRDDTTGLLGKVNGFTFAPDFEVGFWDGHKHLQALGESNSTLYPKLLRFSCEFSVIHEHHLGWHDCTGLWEVVCSTKGAQKLDNEKAAWPYIPPGDSANEYLYIPDPLNKNGSDEVIADGTGTQAAVDAAQEGIRRSPVSAQGNQRSRSATARQQQHSRQGSQSTAKGQLSMEEQAAEDEGNLGG